MELENEIVFECTDLPRSCFDFFEDMKNKTEYCDITFIVGEQRVSAHRIVVAAAIPYFRDKLYKKEEFGDETEIPLPEIEPDTFEYLIEFAYKRKVNINMENVKSLLSAACHLKIEYLRKACCDYLSDRLSLENVLSFRDFACILDCFELLEDIEWYVSEYFEEVSELEGFLDLPFSFVKRVIERDDMRTASEEKVFQTIMRWVKKCPEERKDKLPELLSEMRWLSINRRYLNFEVGKEELIRTSIPCRDLLDIVKNCHFFPDFMETIPSFPYKPRWLTENINVSSKKGNQRIYSVTSELILSTKFLTGPNYNWKDTEKVCRQLYSGVNVELFNSVYYFNGHIALACYGMEDKTTAMFHTGSTVLPFKGRTAVLNAGAVSLDNKIYLCGGSDGVSALKHVDCFDLEKKQWTCVSDMHLPREYPGVAALGHSIYVMGGKEGSSVHDSVERFDFRAGKWRLKLPMLTKRYAAGCTAMNGKIYICGGITSATGEKHVPTAEVYDPMENTWKIIAPMNQPRSHFQLRSLDGKLYASPGRSTINQIEIYTPKTNTWAWDPFHSGPVFCFGNVHN